MLTAQKANLLPGCECFVEVDFNAPNKEVLGFTESSLLLEFSEGCAFE